jgi:adenine-specific DNA-methyltransferase
MALGGKDRVRSQSRDSKLKIGSNAPGRTRAPPTRLALIRSVRSLQKVCVTKKVTPRVLIETVLRKWIQDVYPKLPVKGLDGDHHLADAAAVATFESQLRRLPFLEAAYWLSTAYTALSPKEYRKRMAMYFTPPAIANCLLDDLAKDGVKLDTHSFLDPACGGAAFLTLVADRMRKALVAQHKSAATILRHAESHLHGMDLDETLCVLAQHFLRVVFYAEICATGRTPKFDIRCRDSLAAYMRRKGRRRRFDVVVCNPPYRKLTQAEVEKFRPRFADVMQGQPNLYALFIQLSTKLVKRRGAVGLVTPTSFMSGQSFSFLRTYLLKKATVRHIGIIRDRLRVYLDVEQNTALTIIRPVNRADHSKTVTTVSVVARDGQYQKIGRCALANSGSSWPLARDSADLRLLEKASQSTYRLGDYGYTPTIGAYVWNRDPRKRYRTLKEIPARARADSFPLLWASDVHVSGRLQFDQHAATESQERYVYLGPEQNSMVKRKPAVILQRVSASDQPVRLLGAAVSADFIRDHGGFVGENHVVILEQTSDEPVLLPTMLLKLLKASVINRYFNCISGCANVSIFELQQLPLPDPKALRRLIDRNVPIERAAERVLLGEPA